MANYFELPYEVECIVEREKAIQVEFVSSGKVVKRWCPKGVIHDDSEVSSLKDKGLLRVFSRFAEDEGWEDL